MPFKQTIIAAGAGVKAVLSAFDDLTEYPHGKVKLLARRNFIAINSPERKIKAIATVGINHASRVFAVHDHTCFRWPRMRWWHCPQEMGT